MKDMTEKEYRALARLIVHRMNQGWDSEAMRIYERAIAKGVSPSKLEAAIYTERYGE